MSSSTIADAQASAPDGRVMLDELPFGRFHAKITAMTFGANFSDGYELGIIGSVLPLMSGSYEIDGLWEGLLASAALIGLFFGSLVMGRISDLIGRQRVYVLNFALIAVASICQFWAPNLVTIFVLRLIIGFGLGADYAVGPTLLSEFAPRKVRGMMLSSLTVMWTMGYVVANVVGVYVHLGPDTWRWLLCSGSIPAILVLLVRIGTPESPGWLVAKGRVEDARAVVAKHLGRDDVWIEADPDVTSKARYGELFAPEMRRNTLFGVVFYSALVLPYFAIYTFVYKLLEAMKVKDADLQNLVVNLFLLAGGVAGLWVVEKMTRRRFTLWSFGILTVSLVAMGLLTDAPSWFMMVPFVIYTFVMSGASNITQVYPPELYPTQVRASGVGLLNAVSRIGSAIGTFLLPISITHWGVPASMYWLAAVLAVGFVGTWFWAPNTESKALV